MSASPLWTTDEIAALPGVRLVGTPGRIGGASIDTRTLKPGDLFFAIQGEARDGHGFVQAALAAGASAAVIAESRVGDFTGTEPLVVVPDPLELMREMGRWARARTKARILAVTGSVGKTGTKEALKHVLSRVGKTHASVASYNNHWGVPLTLARMPRETAFGVFEIGMNHAGEIAPLSRLVRPHVGIITTVEPVHIAYFRSILGIADAKGEIFAGLEPGGVAILPRDNAYWERLMAHAAASSAGRIVSFGEGPGADVRGLRIAAGPDSTFVEADVMGRRIAYRIGMPGRHVALNSLAVLSAVSALGLDLGIASAYSDLVPPSGRGERIRLPVAGGGEILVIDESYNANPASVRATLATLGGLPVTGRGRRIAVLSDMKELGEGGPAAHAALASAVEEAGIDLVFVAGELMEALWEALPRGKRGGRAADAAALEPKVLDAVRAGDAVMVKGSNSTRISRVVAALKTRYGAPDEAGPPVAARG